MLRRYPLIAALVLIPFTAALAAELPGDWLKADGRSEEWLKSTAAVRELLGKLKPADAATARCLPLVKELASLIDRTASFGWRQVPCIELLEGVCQDLLDGKTPLVRYGGKELAFPYWSDTLGRMEVIWIHVPPAYDPAKEYQILYLYKCGGGVYFKDGKATGGYRPTVEMANQTPDTFYAWSSLYYGVKGRMCIEFELMESSAAIGRAFSVGADRVFLSGYSDGGFTSIWLATRYPQLIAGTPATTTNWQYSNIGYENLRDVPTLAVDGWGDGGYNTINFIRWHITRTLGFDAAGLWGPHGHTYYPFEDLGTLQRMTEWMKTKKRNLWPKHVTYGTWNLTYHQAYWVSIERMADPSLACLIDVQVKDGNRIEVEAHNVGAYKLTLSDRLVDVARPVTVVTNGKPTYSGPASSDMRFDLTEAKGKFVKSARMPGGIQAQIIQSSYGLKGGEGGFKVADRRWMWVKPTGEGADKLEGWWPSWAKADTEVTDEDLAKFNLFLYGGPAVNKLTARIAADLPVKFEQGRFTIGPRVYDGPRQAVKFIHPNPLNPTQYVIVYAFNDAESFVKGKFLGIGSDSAWGFRGGDCQVVGAPREEHKWGVTFAQRGGGIDYFLFNANWGPPDPTPVGELTAPMDYTQTLRLRADAIREATGTDVGVFSYAPGYSQWQVDTPAGPVTQHDLAVTDMFPQFVCLYEVTGAQLLSILNQMPVSTVLDDKTDPSYDPKTSLVRGEIDPKKTYHVASSFYGLPAYGANTSKIGKYHYFTSVAEWLAGGNTSLPVSNLRQTRLDANEAVARYIRKRGRVAPRPTCFDLVQYVMNPVANEFGACDWLHLGLDVAWPQAGKADAKERYTLNLGLRAADDPEQAPPRADSKKFLDVDLAGKPAPVAFDFATLDKKLAVKAAGGARRFDLVADGKGGWALAAEGTGKDAVGRAVLLELQLTNAGTADVAGVAVLSPEQMARVNPGAWPQGERGKPAEGSYYVGLHTAVGPYRQPPTHQRAVLFLSDPPPSLAKLVERDAGFNFGLVGLKRAIEIKAGQTLALPLLAVAINKPKDVQELDLADVLKSVRSGLLPGKDSQ